MITPQRELIVKWWNDAWNDGLWAASWDRSINGPPALTSQQAAWSPAPGRHSIWQIVLHMIFWRESWLRRAETGVKPAKDEITRLNFPELTDTSEAAWSETCRRFKDSQDRMLAALRIPSPAYDPLMHFLPHDCYHFGQVNYLRAMQGLPPIE